MKPISWPKMKDDLATYLKAKGFTEKSMATYCKGLGFFLDWLQGEDLEAEAVGYNDMLGFVKRCQTRSLSRRTIQNYLTAVRHYYDQLVEQGRIEANPAVRIKVRGIKRQILYPILTPAQLHGLYNGYRDDSLKGKRNKVMLGLMVYQGLRTQDLARLEVGHIKLREGKIEVPGSRMSNARILSLESHQVMDLYDYVLHTRPRILKQSRQTTDRLLVSPEGGENVSNFVSRLLQRLRANNSHLINAQQIRASVIVKWLKRYNLRQVQYRAGHRFVSSTERYKESEMEGLLEEVNRYHPL